MPHPFGRDEARYTWCMLCQRVFLTEDWERNDWMCPSDDCSGTLLDAFPWLPDTWPRDVHPEYPDVPILGGYYPLYNPRPGLGIGHRVNWREYREKQLAGGPTQTEPPGKMRKTRGKRSRGARKTFPTSPSTPVQKMFTT